MAKQIKKSQARTKRPVASAKNKIAVRRHVQVKKPRSKKSPAEQLNKESVIATPLSLAPVTTAPIVTRIILRSEGLIKRYKKRAVVNDVSIDVTQGEIVGLLGWQGFYG
jgi:ATPase subunit of ABC transporter with duplicated ATPase domains